MHVICNIEPSSNLAIVRRIPDNQPFPDRTPFMKFRLKKKGKNPEDNHQIPKHQIKRQRSKR